MSGRRVVVVGGGISGLTAAYRLRAAGTDVTLFEADAAIGGKLASHHLAGIELDAGAESVLARRSEYRDLVDELSLSDRIVAPATSGVEILLGGVRKLLPRKQLLGIPFDFDELKASALLTDVGLARAMRDEHLAPTPFNEDVSVGELVRIRMGQEVVDHLVQPLLAGVYASSPAELSVDVTIPGLRAALQRHGSLAAAARALVTENTGDWQGFIALVGGMSVLTSVLRKHIETSSGAQVLSSARVTKIHRDESSWRVAFVRAGEVHQLEADAILLATSASDAATLLADVDRAASDRLTKIDYASVVLTTLVCRAGDLELPRGTGILVPATEGMLTKAVTYTTQKWKWVADADPSLTVMRLSMGRAGDERALHMSEADVKDVACSEMSRILGQSVRTDTAAVVKWRRAIPLFRVGHRHLAGEISEAVAKSAGLALCGAAIDGVGIPSCIASANAAATRLLEGLA